MASATPQRRRLRGLTGALLTGVLSAAALSGVPLPGGAALAALPTGGTVIVDETFQNDTVPDPSWEPLGRTCLTGAAPGSTPAPDAAQIPPCPANGAGPPPTPGVTPGYLQLNDASGFVGGALLYRRPVPAAAGLSVTFEQYQYAGTAAPGDGIGFYLVDGATPLDGQGADGGSLGYAQRNLSPGVVGGYLGVGLDAYGNFFDDGENRGADCPVGQQSPVQVDGPVAPNVVTLRGPGNGTSGYCYLASTTVPSADPQRPTSTLPGTLSAPFGTTDPAVAKRSVNVQITPAPSPRVIVQIDFQDGNGWQQVLDQPAPPGTPSTYKFGFSASTGGSTDVHLIRSVNAASILPLARLDLVKQVDRSGTPLPAEITAGTVIPYQYVVTNGGFDTLTGLQVSDDRLAPVTCPATELPPAPAQGSTIVCTGTYTVTDADVAAGQVVNTATARAADPGGTAVRSGPSSVTVPLVSSLALTKSVTTPAPHTAGQTVGYAFTVTNTGGSTVSTLVVRDPVIGADSATGAISCPVSVLAPGESTTCTGSYVLTAADLADTGTFTNTATATGQTPIGQTVTSPPASATVGEVADIAVAVTADPAAPPVPSDVTFTVTATNNGPDDATSVILSNPVPSGVTPVSATPSTGTAYDSATGRWSVPALAVGASVQLVVVVRVTTTDPVTDTVQVVSAAQTDPVTDNNTASVTVRPVQPVQTVDIAVTKTVDDAMPELGQEVVFTVTAANAGPAAATGVTVTDLLPASLAYVRSDATAGGYDPATGVWTIGALAEGDRATLTLTARAVATGPATNTAAVGTVDQTDTDPTNDRADASVLVENGHPGPDPTCPPDPHPGVPGWPGHPGHPGEPWGPGDPGTPGWSHAPHPSTSPSPQPGPDSPGSGRPGSASPEVHAGHA
ncbi:lectin-like domain-containing protein [Kitasatospora sp. NBC_01539]|uniref:DUF7507 domain-containing protein n=1 Tax=Kitasatospora sp. NBC_01539 TaxID=2903577 RepID=UPI003860261E